MRHAYESLRFWLLIIFIILVIAVQWFNVFSISDCHFQNIETKLKFKRTEYVCTGIYIVWIEIILGVPRDYIRRATRLY